MLIHSSESPSVIIVPSEQEVQTEAASGAVRTIFLPWVLPLRLLKVCPNLLAVVGPLPLHVHHSIYILIYS